MNVANNEINLLFYVELIPQEKIYQMNFSFQQFYGIYLRNLRNFLLNYKNLLNIYVIVSQPTYRMKILRLISFSFPNEYTTQLKSKINFQYCYSHNDFFALNKRHVYTYIYSSI